MESAAAEQAAVMDDAAAVDAMAVSERQQQRMRPWWKWDGRVEASAAQQSV